MPRSRTRKKTKKPLMRIQKAPIFLIKETEFGPVREWIGEKTIIHTPQG